MAATEAPTQVPPAPQMYNLRLRSASSKISRSWWNLVTTRKDTRAQLKKVTCRHEKARELSFNININITPYTFYLYFFIVTGMARLSDFITQSKIRARGSAQKKNRLRWLFEKNSAFGGRPKKQKKFQPSAAQDRISAPLAWGHSSPGVSSDGRPAGGVNA